MSVVSLLAESLSTTLHHFFFRKRTVEERGAACLLVPVTFADLGSFSSEEAADNETVDVEENNDEEVEEEEEKEGGCATADKSDTDVLWVSGNGEGEVDSGVVACKETAERGMG